MYIAFRQPISQAEIDRLFDADKRGLVMKLRDLKLMAEFAGSDGRFALRQRKNSYSVSAWRMWGELTAASLSAIPPATEQPLI